MSTNRSDREVAIVELMAIVELLAILLTTKISGPFLKIVVCFMPYSYTKTAMVLDIIYELTNLITHNIGYYNSC